MDLLISTDGTHFTAAVFPENSRIKFNSFTVLQSTTGSVFLDAFTKLRVGSESGTLYTSNSNGTFYTRSVANTNRNDKGNVDFERMQSMEGIILVNQIGNMDAVLRGEKKLAQTLLTFNDGGRWSAIPAPTKDSTGATIDCRTISAPSGMDPCRLNLRSRTVIKAPGSIFSVSTAPGLMMGRNMVGIVCIWYVTVIST